MKSLAILAVFIVASLNSVQCLDREMTVQVNPKEMECYFEQLGKIRLASLFRKFIAGLLQHRIS